MKINAKWTKDSQDKEDYDAKILSLCTSYWPGTYDKYDRPSAYSEFFLGHSKDKLKKIAAEYFLGGTPEEVKKQVEDWAQEKFEKIVEVITKAFEDG